MIIIYLIYLHFWQFVTFYKCTYLKYKYILFFWIITIPAYFPFRPTDQETDAWRKIWGHTKYFFLCSISATASKAFLKEKKKYDDKNNKKYKKYIYISWWQELNLLDQISRELFSNMFWHIFSFDSILFLIFC